MFSLSHTSLYINSSILHCLQVWDWCVDKCLQNEYMQNILSNYIPTTRLESLFTHYHKATHTHHQWPPLTTTTTTTSGNILSLYKLYIFIYTYIYSLTFCWHNIYFRFSYFWWFLSLFSILFLFFLSILWWKQFAQRLLLWASQMNYRCRVLLLLLLLLLLLMALLLYVRHHCCVTSDTIRFGSQFYVLVQIQFSVPSHYFAQWSVQNDLNVAFSIYFLMYLYYIFFYKDRKTFTFYFLAPLSFSPVYICVCVCVCMCECKVYLLVVVIVIVTINNMI